MVVFRFVPILLSIVLLHDKFNRKCRTLVQLVHTMGYELKAGISKQSELSLLDDHLITERWP